MKRDDLCMGGGVSTLLVEYLKSWTAGYRKFQGNNIQFGNAWTYYLDILYIIIYIYILSSV